MKLKKKNKLQLELNYHKKSRKWKKLKVNK